MKAVICMGGSTFIQVLIVLPEYCEQFCMRGVPIYKDCTTRTLGICFNRIYFTLVHFCIESQQNTLTYLLLLTCDCSSKIHGHQKERHSRIGTFLYNLLTWTETKEILMLNKNKSGIPLNGLIYWRIWNILLNSLMNSMLRWFDKLNELT